MNVRRIKGFHDELTASWREGCGFSTRLSQQAVRHFGRPGTLLCLYTDQPDVGRIRHLYVLSADRAEGVGRALVLAIILKARQHYRVLRLRTDTQATDAFHRDLGSHVMAQPHATHTLTL